MSNINFDNPWLLLLGIPLVVLVTIPFVIAVRRENKNMHNVLAFVLHLLIVVAATLAFAGMSYDAMITETNVYVLADVSHSSSNNLAVVDGYVQSVEKNLPKNSKMALIAFGRNYQLLSDMGEKPVSVTTADKVDTSATDIASAMRYAGNLFDEDVIKRIVVITDGRETTGSDRLSAVVTQLKEADVYIDVIYLDNNLAEDVPEIQLSDVQYTSSTFLGKPEQAQLWINCNNDGQTRVYIELDCDDGSEPESIASVLYKGENIISVPLRTEQAGTFSYTVTIRPENAASDTSAYNNACLLTQTVSENIKTLFLGGSLQDLAAGREIYGTENVRYISDPTQVPCSVEELCVYDELVLCNFDIRTLADSTQFVSSLNSVVSQFGKTLTTYGNTFVQDTEVVESAELQALGGMLPVNIGNSERDARLMVILLDISTSTNFSSRLEIIREATEKLLDTMDETDKIMVIGFSGDNKYLQTLTEVRNREKILNAISNYECRNGTYLPGGLDVAYDELMNQKYHRRELVIISDGIFSLSVKDENYCIELAEKLSANNIVVSALGVYVAQDEVSLLEKIVKNSEANGKGYYKGIQQQEDIDYAIGDIVENMQQTRIEGSKYDLTLQRPQEDVLYGVTALRSVEGFWYSSVKSGVEPIITAKYMRDKIDSLDVPIYATWEYGNGSVSCFLSDIGSDWTAAWSTGDPDQNEGKFFVNVAADMIPDEQIDSPFIVSPETDGNTTTVYVTTSSFRGDATLTVTLTAPDGTTETKTMFFDTSRYQCSFDTEMVGRYSVHVVYDYAALHYEIDRSFEISYYQEYDAFTTYNVASLYRIVSENGEVSLDGELKMDNSDSATRSYTFSFVVPLMAACAVLFVLEIIVRMLRWKDIRSLFVHEQKKNERR